MMSQPLHYCIFKGYLIMERNLINSLESFEGKRLKGIFGQDAELDRVGRFVKFGLAVYQI